jgi:subtilisin family serine protease/uncharacterized protein YkwD
MDQIRSTAKKLALFLTLMALIAGLLGGAGVQAQAPPPFAFAVSYLSPAGQVGTTYRGAPEGATAEVAGDPADLAAEALRQINALRRANDLPPLQPGDALTAAAAEHAASLVAQENLDHRAPGGSWPADRAIQHGHPAAYLGENLAAGYATAQEAVDAWLANDGSRANLFDPGFTTAGLGFAHNGPWHNYWVLVLADPPAYRPGRVLVRFHPTVSAAGVRQTLAQVNATAQGRVGSLDVRRLAVPVGQEAAVVAALEQNPAVAYAELDARVQITAEPDDPGYAAKWWWETIRTPEAWDLTTGSEEIVIAVVDTGVDQDHSDLADKLVPGQRFYEDGSQDGNTDDDHGHGTHVAGIAAAISDNGLGVAGTSWGARIMPVKVLDSSGSGYYSDVAAGITYAADHGAHVINLSLGGTDNSQTLEAAVTRAYDDGVLLVAAAGNCGDGNYSYNGCSYQDQPNYPAAFDHVLAVASTTATDDQSSFSNQGIYVDIAAPGSGIYSTYPGSYATMSGTSMATPFVTGLAALVLSMNDGLTPDEVESIIDDSAADLGVAGRDEVYGWGRIDAYAAVAAAAPKAMEGSVLAQSGQGVAGALVTIAGTETTTATTDAEGHYSHDGLPWGSYTVTPSLADVTFVPASRTVTIADANATGVGFTAQIAETYTLSGTAQSGDGTGWPDVEVRIVSDHLNLTALTDAQGRFAQHGLIGGTYTVTPSAEGHAFSPASANVAVGDAPVSTQDFQVTAFFVDGAVKNSSDQGVPGVLMTLAELGGTEAITRTTDNEGLFSFTEVISGTYLLTPTLTGATFDPVTRTVVVTTANVGGMDFSRDDYRVYLPVVLRNYSTVVFPDDPSFDSQWGLHNTGQTLGTPDADIDAPEAWGLSQGESDVIVAVIDTGVDLDHPEFAGRLTGGWDFYNGDASPDDDNGHGTHVAGIAAAAGNNGTGVAGVAWGVRIMPVKVLNSAGNGYYSDMIDGIDWALTNGASVINMSLGGTLESPSMQAAVTRAHNDGVLVVAAAGNCGDQYYMYNGCTYQDQPKYPAAHDHVLAVASTTDDDAQASHSNQNDYVDVAAPGSDIYSTYVGGGYAWMDGTSMASPFVAGLAALILSRYPGYTPDQVADAIVHNADDLGATGHDDLFGCGRINAHASLRHGALGSGCSGWGGLSVESVEALAAPPPPPAGAEFRPGALLVGFKETATQAERADALAANGLTTLRVVGGLNIHMVAVPEGQELAFVETLQANPAVAYAEPDYKVYALP